MSIPVVIQTATLKTDGYIYCVGTVNSGAPIQVAVIPADIALLLCLAAGQAGQGLQLVLTALEGTVTF
jgi:hypothetical protein